MNKGRIFAVRQIQVLSKGKASSSVPRERPDWMKGAAVPGRECEGEGFKGASSLQPFP